MGFFNKDWASYIPDCSANQAMAKWHSDQPPREQSCASPSTLLECPRVVWLKKHKVPAPLPMGWGKSQRLLLGRNFENQIAKQYEHAGKLLWHWKDDVAGESVKFTMGEGDKQLSGTPDLLLSIEDNVVVSDAKTSRADSFGYVPLNADEAFKDPYWYKYKLQVEAYYLLCYKNKDWFKEKGLLLPTMCHLFSFALDDGVVRREFVWKPTKETAAQIIHYTTRWNRAYNSKEMPDCTCQKEDHVKFCHYVTEQETTRKGSKIGTKCCNEELGLEAV